MFLLSIVSSLLFKRITPAAFLIFRSGDGGDVAVVCAKLKKCQENVSGGDALHAQGRRSVKVRSSLLPQLNVKFETDNW